MITNVLIYDTSEANITYLVNSIEALKHGQTSIMFNIAKLCMTMLMPSQTVRAILALGPFWAPWVLNKLVNWLFTPIGISQAKLKTKLNATPDIVQQITSTVHTLFKCHLCKKTNYHPTGGFVIKIFFKPINVRQY